MRTISKNEIGDKLIHLVDEENPIDEDIGIISDSGEIAGVVITKEAYDFLLGKIEEEEDKMDSETADEFHKSGEKND